MAIPAVIAEIVAGILIGPQLLGWARVEEWTLALVLEKHGNTEGVLAIAGDHVHVLGSLLPARFCSGRTSSK